MTTLAGDFFAPNSSIIYQNTNYLYGGAGDEPLSRHWSE